MMAWIVLAIVIVFALTGFFLYRVRKALPQMIADAVDANVKRHMAAVTQDLDNDDEDEVSYKAPRTPSYYKR